MAASAASASVAARVAEGQSLEDVFPMNAEWRARYKAEIDGATEKKS